MTTVLDLPIWPDAPFEVPEGFEIRRGVIDNRDILSIYHPATQLHSSIWLGLYELDGSKTPEDEAKKNSPLMVEALLNRIKRTN